jgi:hypothetical protein
MILANYRDRAESSYIGLVICVMILIQAVLAHIGRPLSKQTCLPFKKFHPQRTYKSFLYYGNKQTIAKLCIEA